MAHPLCASSLLDSQVSSTFFPPSKSLQFAPFPYLPTLRFHLLTTPLPHSTKLISANCAQSSLQDPLTLLSPLSNNNIQPNSHTPDGKTASSSPTSYVWVNPKSPRAKLLRRKSYDSRYSSLVRIAEALNTCSATVEDVSGVLIELGNNVVEQDAVVVLNNMANPETALLALKHFQSTLILRREVVLYNVTLKVLRKCRDLDRAENLFEEMLERGLRPDNVTFSTIISCARLCNLPNKAVEWFEKMPAFGCKPDDVSYSAMIDAYGRAGNVDRALGLYDRARTEKWRIDAVTFSTLIKIYGKSGNFDGCLNVYEEMKALGAKPNLFIYNTLLDAMGRARRPWQAKNIYREMTNNGVPPSWGTYASLLRAFCRARYGEDALNVYKEMKEKGMEFNVILYNTLLAMCADVGFTDEAVEIFEEMKISEKCKPDSWTYSSMITIYSCGVQVAQAEAIVGEMLEAGFEPNIFVLTSLIQCYGKANRTDDVVRTFNWLPELGVTPDERFCGCLLNVMTQTPREEIDKIIDCIDKANQKLGRVVKLLVKGNNTEGQFSEAAAELFDTISSDVRKAYCNCLIDLCVNLNMLEKAWELLHLGLTREIYPNIQSRSPTQWSLQLKSLSMGAALTALHVWMNDLSKAVESGEELPPLLGINTGHGKHKYSEKGLASVFESHLKELSAPFHEAPDKAGWFLTTSAAAKSWLDSTKSPQPVPA